MKTHKRSYNVSINTISEEISEKSYEKETPPGDQPGWKCRYTVIVTGFIVLLLLNGYRINMSIGIVAMVNNSAISQHTKAISDSCPSLITNATRDFNGVKQEGEFIWSPQIQGYIQSSYFFGYVVAQVPTGLMAERFGCKWFLFLASVITAAFTLLIPLFAWLSSSALIVAQAMRGLAQGLIQPSTAVLTVNWFPKSERGFSYTIIQSGTTLGVSVGSIFTGLLCQSSAGWSSSFYALGAIGMLLSICIFFFIHESPKDHPNISKAEMDFILDNQESVLTRRRPTPPWRKILTSVPVYALSYGIFGQIWAISQFMIVHATFLGTILHYPIDQNGFLTSVPFLLQFVFSQTGAWLSSYMYHKKIASVDFLRKFWNFVGSLGFSACLLGVYFAGCNRTPSIIFAILSTGFTGMAYAGVWITASDMCPTFVGVVNATCFTLGFMSSIILPLVVGYLTDEMQTLEQWNKVFFISIGVVLSSGIVFAVFGSAEIQPWNYVQEEVSNNCKMKSEIENKKIKSDENTTTRF